MRAVSKTLVALATLAPQVYGQTPAGFSPSTTTGLNVTWNGRSLTAAGTRLTNSEVSDIPVVSTSTGLSGTQLLLLVDPDAPLPPDDAAPQFIHWIQTDVTQSSAGVFSYEQPAFTSWFGPATAAGGAARHNVLLLFQQPSSTFQVPAAFQSYSSSGPTGFNTAEFAEQGNLTLLAATYVLVVNDSDADETTIATATIAAISGTTSDTSTATSTTSTTATTTSATAAVSQTTASTADAVVRTWNALALGLMISFGLHLQW